MYREKLETFESILKKVNVRLRIILSVLKAPLLLHWECVLSLLQPSNAESHPGLLSTKSWKVSMEVEGIQDLRTGLFSSGQQ